MCFVTQTGTSGRWQFDDNVTCSFSYHKVWVGTVALVVLLRYCYFDGVTWYCYFASVIRYCYFGTLPSSVNLLLLLW